tara:strand:- start:340 stop:450 length:111 start_codon:yes stop_codon:yes gene_type:complete
MIIYKINQKKTEENNTDWLDKLINKFVNYKNLDKNS